MQPLVSNVLKHQLALILSGQPSHETAIPEGMDYLGAQFRVDYFDHGSDYPDGQAEREFDESGIGYAYSVPTVTVFVGLMLCDEGDRLRKRDSRKEFARYLDRDSVQQFQRSDCFHCSEALIC